MRIHIIGYSLFCMHVSTACVYLSLISLNVRAKSSQFSPLKFERVLEPLKHNRDARSTKNDSFNNTLVVLPLLLVLVVKIHLSRPIERKLRVSKSARRLWEKSRFELTFNIISIERHVFIHGCSDEIKHFQIFVETLSWFTIETKYVCARRSGRSTSSIQKISS